MIKLIVLSLVIGFSTLPMSAQTQPLAILFDTYREADPQTEMVDLSSLKDKIRLFSVEMKKRPRSTNGLIIYYTSRGEKNVNYCSKEKLTAEIRNDLVREILFASEGISPHRLTSTDGYIRLETEIEFWIVPAGADLPKSTSTANLDCSCSMIEIAGPEEAFKSQEKLIFTVNLIGPMVKDPQYLWSVSSGKIVSGQGTPSIEAKISGSKADTVTASVTIKNANGCCENCDDSASFTTKLTRKFD